MNLDPDDPEVRAFLHDLVQKNFTEWYDIIQTLRVTKKPLHCEYCKRPLDPMVRAAGLVFCISSNTYSCAYKWLAKKPELLIEWATK